MLLAVLLEYETLATLAYVGRDCAGRCMRAHVRLRVASWCRPEDGSRDLRVHLVGAGLPSWWGERQIARPVARFDLAVAAGQVGRVACPTVASRWQ